ncbi:ATPase with chaperone activity, ATP-binding subunit [Rhodococcus qingshengii BKS 20-40]|nr:ATPase with chaperone activity, ATP-binding subunit [Rhodococcus qingshengii BKS 20-40]
MTSAAQTLPVSPGRVVREAFTAEGKTKAMGVAMFERFTDSARRVLILATHSASTRKCDYVGTEHILLGLVEENDGVAAQTLESLGVSVDVLDNQLFSISRDQQPPPGDIPFTPNTKKLLAQSLRETSLLGHDHIGTEHLLLTLLDADESTGARSWARRSLWTSPSCVSGSSGKLPSIAGLQNRWSRNTSPSA